MNALPAIRDITIRKATEADVSLILSFIKELAEYERLSVTATEPILKESLFGAQPAAEVMLAFLKETPVAFAVFFHNFSTFLGRRGLYLEDLYVRPDFRRAGIGKLLLKRLAEIAVERNCGRFEWMALNWNTPAVDFYKCLGAQPLSEWTTFRLAGDALSEMGRSGGLAV